jgi:hypothetical protein
MWVAIRQPSSSTHPGSCHSATSQNRRDVPLPTGKWEDIAKPKRDNRFKISCCGVTICGQRTAAAAISQTDSEGDTLLCPKPLPFILSCYFAFGTTGILDGTGFGGY